jgi:hypothetical protein
MIKILVGALVGASLVFGWQSVANTSMHHHDAAYRPVANAESIIGILSQTFKEEGQYVVPMPDHNATTEEEERFKENMKGKPWAQIIYHRSLNINLGTAIFRSFSTAFLCVLIFIWILGRNAGSFWSVLLKSLGLGFLTFMFVWYNQNIWMDVPWDVLQGELIDHLAAWGLCGLWLGWWLNRNSLRKT